MISSNSVLFTIIVVFGVQAIIFSILILKKRHKRASNFFLSLLILFYSINAINIVVVNVLKDHNLMHVFRYIQMEMLYGIGPALYLYTKSITKSNFKFYKTDWIHFLPLLIEFIFYRTSWYREGANGLYLNTTPNITYVYLSQQWIGVASIIIYSIISLRKLYFYQIRLKQYYSNVKHKSLQWFKIPIIIFGSYYIVWNIITEIDRFAFNRNLREYYFLPAFVLIAILTSWVGFKGYIREELEYIPVEDEEEADLKINKKDTKFINDIKALMKQEKPYLNSDLNLPKLADLLEMNPKLVSQKINQNFNKNFYDFINSYRVAAFKDSLKEEKSKQLSLLGIAYECGFNSKSTFNLVFKKQTQLTPSQYYKSLKNKS